MATYFRSDGWVKSALGPAVPGAQIYVCTQPANIDFLPPTPEADIFSDPNGLVPITQPILTDGFGHYDFYAAPGLYTLIVVNGGTIQQVYPDQSIGGFGTGTNNTGLIAGTNIQIIGNVISATGGGAGVSIQINGSPVTSQTVLNFKDTASVAWSSDGAGGVFATAGAATAGPRPASANWRLWSSSGSNSSTWGSESVGCLPNGQFSVLTGIPPTSTQPAMVQLDCATSAGGSQVIFGDNRGGTEARNYTLGIFTLWQVKAGLTNLTNTRLWIVSNDKANNFEGVLTADNPNCNLVGFRCSASAGDTHFMIYSGVDSANFTIAATTVAADTNIHIFSIVKNGSAIDFYIDNALVGSISTHVPSSSQVLGTTVSLDNQNTTTATAVLLAYSYLETTS